MPLIHTREMLLKAQKENYAVPAFNIENMEMVQAIVETADKLSSPVILQTTAGTLAYADMSVFHAMAKSIADKACVPVALHLDHGNSFDLAVQALQAGYTSVMIDGSSLPFEENIALTKSVTKVAKAVGVPVEAELGMLGGKEDGMGGAGVQYTNPDDAKEFAQRTQIFSLAVAIGTAHGVYTAVPKLDIDRLSQIRKQVDIPLVLHGASGVSDADIKECIAHGICKVNFATQLRIAFTQDVRKTLENDENIIDPKTYSKKGRESVANVVKHYINVCGSNDKANK